MEISRFPVYGKYKPSCFEWAAHIPATWQEKRAKFVFREIDERSSSGTEELLSVSHYTGVTPRAAKDVNMFLAESYEGSKLCKKDDLVINTMWAWMGALGVSDFDGIVSNAYGVYRLRKKSDYHPTYLNYLLRTKYYVGEYIKRSKGIHSSRWRLYPDSFLEIPILIPSLTEQTAIANFLDYKTTLINDFIARKERLIELLQEQKRVIINQAVTRGIDPDVRLKPSGVDWLGDIPKHWEVKKLKYELQCLNKFRIPLSSAERGRMTNRKYDYYGASRIIDKVDDFLFDDTLLLVAEDGANLVMRNLPLAIIATGKFWVNNHAHIFKPYRGDIEYFANLIESMDFNTFITGAAQPKLTQEHIVNISIPVPPVKEQQDIMTYIKKYNLPVDKQIKIYHQEQCCLIVDQRLKVVENQ